MSEENKLTLSGKTLSLGGTLKANTGAAHSGVQVEVRKQRRVITPTQKAAPLSEMRRKS